MNTFASIAKVMGLFLFATAFWYPLFMEFLYRKGIGYHRDGKLRRIRITEWLNATGIGIFLGAVLLITARILANQ